MKNNFLTQAFRLYYDGFRNLGPVGKRLLLILLLKLIILFAVLRLFFFQDFLQKNFDSDKERTDHVLEQLTKPSN